MVLGLVFAIGAATLVSPWLPVVMALGLFALCLGSIYARVMPRVFLFCLGCLLVGYAFMGRGFAYIGMPMIFGVLPIYIGEVALGIGLLAALVRGGLGPALSAPVSWTLLAFAIWGAIRTLPYIQAYGVDALRDAVVWGYGAFALFVGAFLWSSGWTARVFERYWRCAPWYLLWVPVAAASNLFFESALPHTGEDAPLPDFKPGDYAVHLAGVAAFLVLGLHRLPSRESQSRLHLSEPALWMIWLAGFLICAAKGRGGALAVAVAFAVVLTCQPLRAGRKMILLGVLAGAVTIISLVSDWSVGRDSYRPISPRQVVENYSSIGGGGSEASRSQLEGSRKWRLNWWNGIIQYTIYGPYFWTGKGYGINVGEDDRFGTYATAALRSPHNIHMTILARTGVPGLALWVSFLGAFTLSLISAYWRARRSGRDWWARANVWILAYWAASLMNATFDVYLEGPQGGIWFWSIVGLGIVVVRLQREPGDLDPSRVSGVRTTTTRIPPRTHGMGVKSDHSYATRG
jgi:hypothetical protein